MPNSLNPKDDKTIIKQEIPEKKEYNFGGIQEYSLEKIENEILEESVYLDVFAGSDINFKKDIHPLGPVLSSLKTLNCISYCYKKEIFPNKEFPSTRQFGVIAQDVEKTFPELTMTDKEGYLHVNYSQLTVVALQAIKELSSSLAKSNERIDQLELQLKNVSRRSNSLDSLTF